jgi:acetolactate synthase-1/3 small subunit
MKHTISLLVENHLGTLSRIAGLFSGRGYNIDSITVGEAEEPGLARMTITTQGDEQIIEQITKQLNRLVDVIKVIDFTYEPFVSRELALIKVAATTNSRHEIMEIVNIFRAKIIDISPKTVTVEVTGSEAKIDAIVSMLRPFGVKELARTGTVALRREFQGQT